MSSNQKSSRIQEQTADQSLINGFTKHATTLSSFLVGGATIKASDVITALQARITAANTTQSTRATWQAAVKANATTRTSTQTLVSNAVQALKVMFAGSIETLADFGLKPRKVRTAPTPEAKVAAAAKAKATREARHTMGSKQKKGVKGTMPAAVPTTPPAASPPVVAPPRVP